MAQRDFSRLQRFGLYTAHEPRCYMCRKPLAFSDMRIDHVIPAWLAKHPEKLSAIVTDYGLSQDFDLEGWSNLLPACERCNTEKGSEPFDPAPIILRHLKLAAERSTKVDGLIESVGDKVSVSKAVGRLEAAISDGKIDTDVLKPLLELYQRSQSVDGSQTDQVEFHLTPEFKVVKTSNGYGYVPTTPNPHSSYYCGRCGSLGPWSGARCLSCGYLDDGD